jgi:hypothetical protein
MKITALPIDVYRQAGAFSADTRDAAAASTTAGARKNGSVTLPVHAATAAETVAAGRGPSPFAGVLSTEEKNLLMKYFARFGDAAPAAPAYGVESRGNQAAFTGANLDVKV